MVSSNLKKMFEKAVAATVKPLGSLGVTPNQVTALGLIVAFVSAWLYADWDGGNLADAQKRWIFFAQENGLLDDGSSTMIGRPWE